MVKGLILLGTGPKVGKTYVCSLLLDALKEQGARPGYFKFAQLGSKGTTDAQTIAKNCHLNQEVRDMCPYNFTKEDTVVHLAVREERRLIELTTLCERFAWNLATHTHMIVEGVGEIVSPLVFEQSKILFQDDVVKRLRLNTILLTKMSASALSQCVLATHYLRSTQNGVGGIILNGYDDHNYTHRDTRIMIERCCQVPIVGTVAPKGKFINLLMDLEEFCDFPEIDDGREEIEI